MKPKTISLLAYLSPLGWLIALVAQWRNKSGNALAHLHLTQGLGLTLATLLYVAVANLILWVASPYWLVLLLAAGLTGLLLLGVLGCCYAALGKRKTLPLIGKRSARIFSFLP